ncbi:MAG TPA: 3-hydroxybutyrate dehydrogenase [Steroidobacteraceae bacterium]|nr:3-hydroxybutyrate dehydrogenase [Steroidobacteraceae bacterium]
MSRRRLRALVTGAASGIGLGLAQYLCACGHEVWLSDKSLGEAEQAVRELAAAGLAARALELDVTSTRSIESAVAELGEAGVDLLVNNAGLQHVSPLEEFPPERWALLIDVMLTGPAMVTRALLPGMRRRNFGRIVNVGSIHSLVASPYKSAYVAAKHGLTGLAKTIALETSDVDVTINTVCPAYVRTPLVDAQITAQARSHGIPEQRVVDEIMLKPMPKGVFVTVEELGALVEFLASDAARNITGQAISVDGGWTAH